MATRRGFLRTILSAGAAVPLAALPQPKGDDTEVAALKARLAELEDQRVEFREEWTPSYHKYSVLPYASSLANLRERFEAFSRYGQYVQVPNDKFVSDAAMADMERVDIDWANTPNVLSVSPPRTPSA